MTREVSEDKLQRFYGYRSHAWDGYDSDTSSTWESDSDNGPEDHASELEGEDVLDSIYDGGMRGLNNTHRTEMDTGDLAREVENLDSVPGDTFFGVDHEEMMRDLQNESFFI